MLPRAYFYVLLKYELYSSQAIKNSDTVKMYIQLARRQELRTKQQTILWTALFISY